MHFYLFASFAILLLPPFHLSCLVSAKPTASVFPELNELFLGNSQWAANVTKDEPEFFSESAKKQEPKVLWIGCSDSRVPESAITGCKPGEIFVHRNIANQLHLDDESGLSALTYAVEHLHVEHVVVVGHTNCGGVISAFDTVHNSSESDSSGHDSIELEHWLEPLVTLAESVDVEGMERDVALTNLSEANVREQVENASNTDAIRHAWELAKSGEGNNVYVHGWIYELETGQLRDLGVTRGPDGPVRPRLVRRVAAKNSVVNGSGLDE